MADTDIDVTRTRLGNYYVKWDSYVFGATDKVTPDISLVTKEMKVGTIGDVVLGERVIAVTGTIMVECREIDATLLTAVMPWATTALNPADVHKDLYEYAKQLTLHPTDVAFATKTQDIVLLKAVPLFKPMDRDGSTDDKLVVAFKFYPDRTKLPTLDYGYIGTAPGGGGET